MSAPVTTTCYHCGEHCEEQSLLYDSKPFCCDGCRTVYSLLSEHDLTGYYAIEKTPGTRSTTPTDADRFAWLDDPQVQEKLLDFDDGTTANVTFFIPQIHCSSCIWVLEQLYKFNAAVRMSRVHFPKKELTISFNKQQASLRDIVTLLARIGYEPKITFAETSVRKAGAVSRTLYYKLGVAGFCFGNIMLLSFPEYLDQLREQDAFYVNLFNYLNVLLSLPVLFYSGAGFFGSAWRSLREKIINMDVPIALGMATIFLVSLWEIILHSEAGYLDSLTGLVFFLLIGRIFQQKSYDALSFERDYKSFFPVAVTRLSDGLRTAIPLEKLRTGDRLLVRNGELIPADALLFSTHATVDYSFVTGESAPVEVVAGEKVFAGGRLVGTAAEVETVKEVSQSYLTGLWNNAVFTREKVNGLERFSNTVSRHFTLVILTIAVVSAGYWLVNDPGLSLRAFTSVLIIACPCALALSIPFTFGNALRVLGRNKLFLKHTGVIHAMADTDHVVLDKTGTLTDTTRSEVRYHGVTLGPDLQSAVRSLVHQSIHPLSRRIEQSLEGPLQPVEAFKELPGKGLEGRVGNRHIRIGKYSYVSAGPAPADAAATAATKVFVSVDGEVTGFFTLSHQYRPGLPALTEALHRRYRVAVVSGDHDTDREALDDLFAGRADLQFEKSPEEKLDYVAGLQEQGRRVLMAGDGLNDAGALRQSDVGIAVSEDVSGFSPSSDGILDASAVTRLDRMLRYARISRRVVKGAFVLSFLYNVVGLSFAVQGALSPVVAAVLMPLSSVTIVAYAFAATWLGARYAGLERV